MYANVDFETFIKSVSAMTGFTGDQIKTLLAYRDVKYLDETTAADLTAELNKLRDEMIKANPTGFGIKGPQTPLFPLEHISKVAGSFTLEELLLMVFIDWPALIDYRGLSQTLTADEHALFMAVKCPEFITDPQRVINGKCRSIESQRVNALVDRLKLAVSMYNKMAVSREVAAKLAGVNLEDFGYILQATREGNKKSAKNNA